MSLFMCHAWRGVSINCTGADIVIVCNLAADHSFIQLLGAWEQLTLGHMQLGLDENMKKMNFVFIIF